MGDLASDEYQEEKEGLDAIGDGGERGGLSGLEYGRGHIIYLNSQGLRGVIGSVV